MQNQLVSNLFRVCQLCPRLFSNYNLTDFDLVYFHLSQGHSKAIEIEGLVCVIYVLPSICSGYIVLVIIFSQFRQIKNPS